jgi:Phytanoyl-CoA dioxygenase (PhyH)
VTVATPDLAERFEAEGYVVVDSRIDAVVVDGAVADVERMFAALPPAQRRVQDAWKASENVRRIALQPSLLETLAALYGRTPRAFQTLNFRVGSEQRPHADAIHFDSVPSGYMCGVWVALEDIDMDNGPLVYYPGSHKLPQISFSDLDLPPYKRYYPKYEEAVERLVEERVGEVLEGVALEPRYATLRRGQALIWSANLIHGGAPQRDPRRTRHTQVTHYFFEGFRYRTPMRSGRFFTYWRYPEWVRPDGPRRDNARNARTHLNSLKWLVFAAAAKFAHRRSN